MSGHCIFHSGTGNGFGPVEGVREGVILTVASCSTSGDGTAAFFFFVQKSIPSVSKRKTDGSTGLGRSLGNFITSDSLSGDEKLAAIAENIAPDAGRSEDVGIGVGGAGDAPFL